MSCILRVFGERLDIDKLISTVSMEPDHVWHKGEPRYKSSPEGDKIIYSGAFFYASDADMEEPQIQIEEATEYLNNNLEAIKDMTKFSGVEEVILDFGIELRDVAIHSDYLTPALVKVAGEAGIGIELSHYPFADDES